MDFKSFSELREFVRRYNSTSVLRIGTERCWQKREVKYSSSLDWLYGNIERNYAVRLMLLASAGNSHRHENISVQAFNDLINAYHNWDGHTISDKHILEEEVKVLLSFILKWEIDNEKTVRNWSLNLSSILNLEVISDHIASLFVQRLVAFQNAGFGSRSSRIKRAIKLVELLNNRSNKEFSDTFLDHVGLSPKNYFRQFLACLILFDQFSERRGFCNLSQLPNIERQLQEFGITPENLKVFVKRNSAPFSTQVEISFRRRVNQTLNNVPGFYQPLFYNHFLEIPFVELSNEEFCLPDPFSLTESCWNQVKDLVSQSKLEPLLSRAFEDYLENVLFPLICPNSFKRIPEVKNPSSSKDKRADFLIETSSAYIVVECKSSVMSSDTSAYFQADKLADLWCRIHSAFEQISVTVEAFNLYDKPVIPLILTFYDSVAASTGFEEMVKQTSYCSRMRLNMPPIVRSLHEFEHWISDRSINNWSELILSQQNAGSPVQRDNKGHNYEHLNDISRDLWG